MLDCQREAFQLPADVHYLNGAYMSPLLRRVEEAGIEGMRRKRNPSTITPADFFEDSASVRTLFADLIKAKDASRVAIIPSASYGLSTVARNIPLQRGQTVLMSAGQMPSNVYCWRRVAEEAGAQMRVVEPPAPGEGSFTEALEAAIDDRTAVVALGTVHWTDGRGIDAELLADRARAVGAHLVLDGTQSIGVMPFDVERVRPTAVVSASYKWLLGPYSIGVAWYGPVLDGGVPLEETWLSRPGSDDFSRLADYRDDYREGATRYDVGETANFILLPMLRAALEQLSEWTVEAIAAYCRRLTDRVANEATRLGYGVPDADERAPHIIGLRLDPAQGEALRSALERRHIQVAIRGEAVRVSTYLYNDDRDIAALTDALEEAAGVSSR
ncbi:MAG: aminotransferase class V-fold PLP-dependent enzyme [Gemmatimonadales bacterium]